MGLIGERGIIIMVYWSAFLSQDKIPDTSSLYDTHKLKEERLIWLTVTEGSVHSSCLQSRSIVVKGLGTGMFSSYGRTEQENSAREEGTRTDIVAKVMPPQPIQTYPEVCFTNPLGGSEANQFENPA